jgi:hypothetical protein
MACASTSTRFPRSNASASLSYQASLALHSDLAYRVNGEMLSASTSAQATAYQANWRNKRRERRSVIAGQQRSSSSNNIGSGVAVAASALTAATKVLRGGGSVMKKKPLGIGNSVWRRIGAGFRGMAHLAASKTKRVSRHQHRQRRKW